MKFLISSIIVTMLFISVSTIDTIYHCDDIVVIAHKCGPVHPHPGK